MLGSKLSLFPYNRGINLFKPILQGVYILIIRISIIKGGMSYMSLSPI